MKQACKMRCGVIGLIAALFAGIVVYAIGTELLAIKLGISILLGIAFSDGIYYAFCGYFFFEDHKNRVPVINTIIIIVLILLAVYAPLFTQNGFFHDDYINFKGNWGGNHFFEFTFSQGRQATGILTDLMNYVTVVTSWHLHVISVISLIVYALILFQTIYALTSSLKKAVYISLMMSLITPAINVVSYGSMFCYSLAFCFSATGILHFRNFFGVSKENRIFHLIMGGLSIITANFVYQAAATVAFSTILLCYLMDSNQESDKLFPIKASVLFVFSTGIYYILVKVLIIFNNRGLMTRASIISDFTDIINKIVWFKTVLLEAIKQLISAIVGVEAFTEPWLYYYLQYKNEYFGVVTTIFLVLIILGLLQIWKRYRVWGIIQTGCMIVLSYYVFLILRESNYLSYYAVALSSSLLLIILCGFDFIYSAFRFFNKKRNTKSLTFFKDIGICFICLVMCLNGNYYMRSFWINYNYTEYNALKQQIAETYQGESRIHIIGTLHPNQADAYASSAARLACKEIGIDVNNIKFTSSSNSDYVTPLVLNVYNEMILKLPEEDIEFLERIYLKEPDFNICTLQPYLMEEGDYERLSLIFRKTDVIPDTDSEDTLVVTLH